MSRIAGIIRQSLESSAPWATEQHLESNMEFALEGMDLQRQQREIEDVAGKLQEMVTSLETIDLAVATVTNPDPSLVVMCRMQLQDTQKVFGIQSTTPTLESIGDPMSDMVTISNESKSLGGKIWAALVWLWKKFTAFLKWINPWSKDVVKKTEEDAKEIDTDLKEIKETVVELEKVDEAPVEVTPTEVETIERATAEVIVLKDVSKKLPDLQKETKVLATQAADLVKENKEVLATIKIAKGILEERPHVENKPPKNPFESAEEIALLLRDYTEEVAKGSIGDSKYGNVTVRENNTNPRSFRMIAKEIEDLAKDTGELKTLQKNAVSMMDDVERIRKHLDGVMGDIGKVMSQGPLDQWTHNDIRGLMTRTQNSITASNKLMGLLQKILDSSHKTVNKTKNVTSAVNKRGKVRRGKRGKK